MSNGGIPDVIHTFARVCPARGGGSRGVPAVCHGVKDAHGGKATRLFSNFHTLHLAPHLFREHYGWSS